MLQGRISALLLAAGLAGTCAAGEPSAAPDDRSSDAAFQQFIKSSCLDCHDGPEAKAGLALDQLIASAPQPLSPPHGLDSPVGRVHELDGQVLLLGVTHGESTTLHLAEALAGVPYSVAHPCVVEVCGAAQTLMLAETDHCCSRFPLMDGWLRARGLQREGTVGHAAARLASARDIVAVATEQLRRDPLLFLCPASAGCAECDRARASVR